MQISQSYYNKIVAIYGCLGTLIQDRRKLNNEKSQSVVETLVVIIYYRKLCIITSDF